MCQNKKTCKVCQVEKDVCCFSSNKAKNGIVYRFECKPCAAARRRKERVDHPERSKAKWAKVKSDPELFAKAQAKDKAYRALHVDEIRANAREYAKQHREERRIYSREYTVKLRERFVADPDFWNKWRTKRNIGRKIWLDANPDQRIAMALRSRMHALFRKERSTFDAIGCDRGEFCAWIEYQLLETPEFTMANYGACWHLDHVRPCASYDLENEDEQRRCFHWSNIQPLEGEENLAKNDQIMVNHLIRQLDRYSTYIEHHNIEDSKYDIQVSYRELLDGASPTTSAAKAATGIQGNDLGHGKNGEDWVIRSQDALLERVTRLEEKLDTVHTILIQIIDQLQRA